MDTRAVTNFEWRCTHCGTLLGVELRGRMHLKYKSAQYVVTGPVRAVCRRCETTNETFCPRGNARGESAAS
jgi:phage FluMu protein Com